MKNLNKIMDKINGIEFKGAWNLFQTKTSNSNSNNVSSNYFYGPVNLIIKLTKPSKNNLLKS